MLNMTNPNERVDDIEQEFAPVCMMLLSNMPDELRQEPFEATLIWSWRYRA
jgi:hypothetical protein